MIRSGALSLPAGSPFVALGATAAVAVGLALAVLPAELGLAAVIGVALLVAVAWQPAVGVGLAIIAGPARAYLSIARPGTFQDPGQILLALALAGWAARSLWRRDITIPRTWLWLPLVAYVSVGLLSLLPAQSLTDGLREIAKWVQVALVLLVILPEVQRGRHGWLIGALLLAGLAQAAVGLWQFGFQTRGPEHFQLAAGNFRAYGSFEQPNPYGGFLGLLWPLAAGLCWAAVVRALRGRQTRDWLSAAGLALAAGLMLAGLFASFSRGAWLGAAAAAGTMAIVLPRRWLAGLLLGAAGLALALGLAQAGLLPGAIQARLADMGDLAVVGDVRGVNITSENFAVIERLAHWQAAESMARQHPWLGVGIGNYSAVYAEHALLNWEHPLGHAHMVYLNVLAETGLLGLLTYMALWVIIFVMTLRAIRRHAGLERGLALGLLGAWVHLSVHHLVDYLFVNNIHLTVAALLCLLAWLTNWRGSARAAV
jgi:putative inorganic carbon (hco3(-)) transporter